MILEKRIAVADRLAEGQIWLHESVRDSRYTRALSDNRTRSLLSPMMLGFGLNLAAVGPTALCHLLRQRPA